MGTKSDPGVFNCYANAKPDEPMFVLLGRDPVAAIAVAVWAALRIRIGLNKMPEDDAQIADAGKTCAAMEDYAKALGKKELQEKLLVIFEEMGWEKFLMLLKDLPR